MNINIILNNKNGCYYLKSIMNKQEQNVFFDAIVKIHSDIKKYDVFVKNGTIYSYNLEDIKKVKNMLLGYIFFNKLQQ